jgi:hypothetical protein
VENKGKLTEQSLFKFVEFTSMRPLNYPKKPTEILALNQYPPDIFLEIFSNDYLRIIKGFAIKRAMKQGSRQLVRQGTMRRKETSITMVSDLAASKTKKRDSIGNQLLDTNDDKLSPKNVKEKKEEEFLTLEDFCE